MPSVSFVIPSYNQARFLGRCLDRCLAQEAADAEVLVQDGLSTDGTQELLRGYGRRIDWVSEQDAGHADAVNRGVARARGEIIAWINSDDCYATDRALAPVLAAFDADPELDVVYGDALVVDEAGAPIRPYVTRDFASSRDLLLAPQGPSQPATLFRRRLFLEAGGLRADLPFALDYELWLRLFPLARRVRRIPQTIAWMTSHPDAKSIRAMLPHIRELGRVKQDYAARLGLGVVDRLRATAGVAALYAYWGAVRLGLRRAV